jgi:hypothetical protein
LLRPTAELTGASKALIGPRRKRLVGLYRELKPGYVGGPFFAARALTENALGFYLLTDPPQFGILRGPLAGGDRMQFDQLKRREFITLFGGVVSLFLWVSAAAQEGYYGVGHDKWHQGFYSKLKRNDGQGSCCNLMDCRPTQSRMVGDHCEVKVDGAWTPVPYDKINNVIAPDGGAHVCVPRQIGQNKGVLFCVILPTEG